MSKVMADVHRVADVYTDLHFVFTGGTHGDSYVNYRSLKEAKHQALLYEVTVHVMLKCLYETPINLSRPIIIVGPETLGAKMSEQISLAAGRDLPPEFNLGESHLFQFGEKQLRVTGLHKSINAATQLIFVDDLLNQGHTTHAVGQVTKEAFGLPITTIAVIGDRSNLSANDIGVQNVIALETFGFSVYDTTKERCRCCEQKIPIVRKPGHGFKYEEDHSDYPGGYIDL